MLLSLSSSAALAVCRITGGKPLLRPPERLPVAKILARTEHYALIRAIIFTTNPEYFSIQLLKEEDSWAQKNIVPSFPPHRNSRGGKTSKPTGSSLSATAEHYLNMIRIYSRNAHALGSSRAIPSNCVVRWQTQ